MSFAAKKNEGGCRTRGRIKQGNSVFPPLVSVITATYNAEKDLEECIRSVVKQVYVNIELIIIDGGSTDGTLDIINKYDDRIDYWLSEDDRGVYDAFNKAIDLANGDWLLFLGADDRLADENVLNRVFSKYYKSKLLYGNVLWGNTGKIYDGKFLKRKLFWQNICQQAVFYHRDLFNSLGRFDTQYKLAADWVFNIKAFGWKETKPFFIDTIISEYCTEGMSTDIEDDNFYLHRKQIFLDSCGKFALFLALRKDLLEKPVQYITSQLKVILSTLFSIGRKQ